jgi:alkanesulfonate monooxygenase SsuD/methylene tetrahydromethanopterin reductase-like flavin-dependent oxidoreductase (luciferase family)
MQYGLYFPNFGKFGDPDVVVEIAATAERAGWEGVFPFDHLQVGHGVGPVIDTWVTLAAVAAVTERIRIGPMVTPVPRRRPAKLAHEAVTLDHLSGGQLILGVGIGGPPDEDFGNFGDAADNRIRGEQLDEGLELLDALWSGEVVNHQGTHYTASDARFLPRPVQLPRIPVWVGGMWPRKPAFRRAARWDGVFPIATGDTLDDYVPMTPEILTDILAYVAAPRATGGPFDVAVIGSSFPATRAARQMTSPRPERPGGWSTSTGPTCRSTRGLSSSLPAHPRGGFARRGRVITIRRRRPPAPAPAPVHTCPGSSTRRARIPMHDGSGTLAGTPSSRPTNGERGYGGRPNRAGGRRGQACSSPTPFMPIAGPDCIGPCANLYTRSIVIAEDRTERSSADDSGVSHYRSAPLRHASR